MGRHETNQIATGNSEIYVFLRVSKTNKCLRNSPKQIVTFSSKFEDHESYDLDQAEQIVSHEKFDARKKTVMYFHGYIESPEVESVHVIVDAYQKRGDHNLIVLDWTNLADGSYLLEAVPNCLKVCNGQL